MSLVWFMLIMKLGWLIIDPQPYFEYLVGYAKLEEANGKRAKRLICQQDWYTCGIHWTFSTILKNGDVLNLKRTFFF